MANEARVNIQTQVKISTLRAVPARLPQMQSSPIRVSFRGAFLFSATLAFIAGIYLVWLWQPDRQVRLHTAHLIRQLEKRNWSAAQYFIAADYHDDWGDDRDNWRWRSCRADQRANQHSVSAVRACLASTIGQTMGLETGAGEQPRINYWC